MSVQIHCLVLPW